jgi:AraC-like DNA-binding protein
VAGVSVKVSYNVKNLEKIINDLSIAMDVNMAFYDSEQRPLYIPSSEHTFCSMVQCRDGAQSCLHSDALLLKKCNESRQVEQHLCHTGLCDLAMPIIIQNVVVGYIILGQIRTPDTAANPPKRFEALTPLYHKTPYFSYDKLACIKDLLPRILFSTAIKIDFENYIYHITEYIEQNLHKKLNIAFICSKFHISKDSLYDSFRETFHCTVNEYISEQRLEKAKSLLATTNLPIYQITESIGFENATYFCHLFKTKLGISPSEYRKQHAKQKEWT